jgi:cytochrome bd-type quinol oxidase subunit 2
MPAAWLPRATNDGENMRIENLIAWLALVVLALVVLWDVLTWFGIVQGHSITHEIRSDWRSWAFFLLAGTIAGGHFLAGK